MCVSVQVMVFGSWQSGVLCTVYCVLCTVYCVLCTVYCVLCTVYCVLCTVYCVLCTVYCVLCTVYCVLCTVYCVLCTVYCVLCTVYCVLCTVYCVLCTVYCVLCTVYCVLCTVYCVLCTVYCEEIDQKRELVHFVKLTPPLAARIPKMQMPVFKCSGFTPFLAGQLGETVRCVLHSRIRCSIYDHLPRHLFHRRFRFYIDL